MAKPESHRPIRCPECFSKDMDIQLLYDENNEEYYCYKCCYTGKYDEVLKEYEAFVSRKYRALNKKTL